MNIAREKLYLFSSMVDWSIATLGANWDTCSYLREEDDLVASTLKDA